MLCDLSLGLDSLESAHAILGLPLAKSVCVYRFGYNLPTAIMRKESLTGARILYMPPRPRQVPGSVKDAILFFFLLAICLVLAVARCTAAGD